MKSKNCFVDQNIRGEIDTVNVRTINFVQTYQQACSRVPLRTSNKTGLPEITDSSRCFE
jgi:hypothetical protein